jgi:glutathione peroxidase-family protein
VCLVCAAVLSKLQEQPEPRVILQAHCQAVEAAPHHHQDNHLVVIIESSTSRGVQDIDNKDLKLSKYAGKVVLVCNVASQCGFTPQYTDLAALYDKYSSKGLVVVGAPCNQFGAQEPGSNAEIKKFAKDRGAKFPLLAKLDVNGPNESALYSFLKKEKGGVLTSDVKYA